MVQAIDRKTDEGFDKGSLAMFEEWIYINVKAEFNINDKIIKPLKTLEKLDKYQHMNCMIMYTI